MGNRSSRKQPVGSNSTLKSVPKLSDTLNQYHNDKHHQSMDQAIEQHLIQFFSPLNSTNIAPMDIAMHRHALKIALQDHFQATTIRQPTSVRAHRIVYYTWLSLNYFDFWLFVLQSFSNSILSLNKCALSPSLTMRISICCLSFYSNDFNHREQNSSTMRDNNCSVTLICPAFDRSGIQSSSIRPIPDFRTS